MYHARPQITAEPEGKRRAQTGNKYVVIGEFPISGDSAANLTRLLGQSGSQVVTISANTPSVARVRLQFKSRRLWAKTVAAIDYITSTPTVAIIYPAGLAMQDIDKPRWQNRRMEEWRRFLIAYRIAARSNNCTVVIDETASWFIALVSIAVCLRKPLTTKLCIGDYSTPKLIKRVIGNRSVPISAEMDWLTEIQHPRRGLRHQAIKLEREDASNAPVVAELRWAQDIAETLRHTCQQLLPNMQSTDINREKMILANRIPEGQRLSAFMQHFLTTTEIADFAGHPDDFITWYLHAPVNRKSMPALPIPLPILVNTFAKSDGTTPDHLCGQISNLAGGIEYGPFDLRTVTGRSAFLIELILNLARRSEDLTFLPVSLLTYFRTPVGSEAGNVSRMELICFALGAQGVPAGVLNPWNSEQIVNWFQRTICKQAPSMEAFSTAAHPCGDVVEPNTVQILGITGDQSGLAQNTQMSVEALTLANLPLDLGSRPFNRTWARSQTISTRQLNQSVTLHHVNADQIPTQILMASPSLQIGFLLWELEQIPPSHLLAGTMLDEVWVPSSYVQKLYADIFDCNVVNVGKGFSLPEVAASNMAEYGLNADHFVFLMCFDAHSSVERKNPMAAVLAFLAAFPNDPNVRLLIKTTPVSPGHWGDPNRQMQQIREISRRDPRVIIDQRMLPFNGLLALIKRADCIVSTHRAEGFGYIPAYALWLGRPVIATDYSGTQDLCTPATAFPVSYKLIETRIGETITPMANAYWADIDVEALSQTLVEVRDSPLDAQIKALRGQNLLHTKYTPKMQAKRYLNRFEALGVLTK